MSQLDQAKKEAKRLFNLAKANQESNQSPEIQISIPKLSSAREIVAVMNGYKNWHDYEAVLKRKDFMFDKVDKNTENKELKMTLERKKYFIQDIDFNNIENPNKFKQQHQVIIRQPHIPIVLGHKKEKTFFDNKEKYWSLNQYPVLLTGSTGSGKTETLLSLGSQYIKNGEGLIYIDANGDTVLYPKVFSYAKENNRLDDLYCLNFMTGSRDLSDYNKDGAREKLSHSIDPINPMVGNDQYFEHFFGKEIGGLIHAILKNTHEKNQMMDIQSLESILMLNNLMKWKKENTYNDLQQLNEYLISIGLSLEEDNDETDLEDALDKHALNCIKAYETVNLLKLCSYVFKIDCSIDMTQIFLQRKILIVLLPALYKSIDSLSILGELITAQIAYTEQKIDVNTHMQNIILDEFIYYAKNINQLKLSTTKNNYIFGAQDFGYLNKEEFNYVFNNSKTYVGMKFYCDEIHNKLKLEIINNASEFPKEIFGSNGKFIDNLWYRLREQKEGQAIVFCMNNERNTEDDLLINSENKYYMQKLQCVYLTCPKPKEIWLVDQPRPIINIRK